MKKSFVKLFVLLVSISLNASLITVSAQKNEPFSVHTFSASSINMVESSLINGSITVTGGGGSEAVVEMYVSGNSSKTSKWSNEEIKKYLDENYTIEVRVNNEKLVVVAKPKNGGKKSKEQFDISLKVKASVQVSTDLKTTNGSIQISNLSGSQKIKTVNGSLDVDHVLGKISGSTINGSITVTGSKDDINLSTVNGGITAKDCDGKVILNTVNGRVKRENAG